jgi:hypothetical protein
MTWRARPRLAGPRIACADAGSLDEMALLNLFCKLAKA